MKKLLLLLCILSFSSCQLSTRKDDAEDKEAAEAVISKFLSYRKQKEVKKINELFSAYYYSRNDSGAVKTSIDENYEKYGDIISVKLLNSSVHTSTHLFRTIGSAIFIYQFSSALGTWKEAYGLSLKDGEYLISNFKILKAKPSSKKQSTTD